jgi:hypothetical protein
MEVEARVAFLEQQLAVEKAKARSYTALLNVDTCIALKSVFWT